jgi:hypothetical protein
VTIEDRVRRLEAHCNRWRIAASLLAVLLIVTLCVGQTRPAEKNLEVESIRFRDEQGRVRLVIASTSFDKLPELPDMAKSAKLYGNRVTGLAILDERGQSTTSIVNDSIMLTKPTTGGLSSLFPGDLLVCGVDPDGLLRGTNVTGEEIAVASNSVSLTKDGCKITDSKGASRAILGTARTTNAKTGASTTSAPGALTLFDADGKVLFQQP